MESGAKGGMESRTNGRAHLEKALVCRAPNSASVSYDSQWLINFCQMSFMEGTKNGWQRVAADIVWATSGVKSKQLQCG